MSGHLFRYGFKLLPSANPLEESFATLDTGKAYALKYSKKTCSVYMYDMHATPHRLIGQASGGYWRHPVATCRVCKGKCWVANGEPCDECDGLGCKLEALPWRAN